MLESNLEHYRPKLTQVNINANNSSQFGGNYCNYLSYHLGLFAESYTNTWLKECPLVEFLSQNELENAFSNNGIDYGDSGQFILIGEKGETVLEVDNIFSFRGLVYFTEVKFSLKGAFKRMEQLTNLLKISERSFGNKAGGLVVVCTQNAHIHSFSPSIHKLRYNSRFHQLNLGLEKDEVQEYLVSSNQILSEKRFEERF